MKPDFHLWISIHDDCISSGKRTTFFSNKIRITAFNYLSSPYWLPGDVTKIQKLREYYVPFLLFDFV